MEACNIATSQMIPLSEVVKSLLIRDGDYLGTQYLRYFEFAKAVYRFLNLSAIRYTKRYAIEVNREGNFIQLPKDFLQLSSLQVVDDCGQLIPLVPNKNLTGPVVEKNQPRDCGCECGCTDALCGTLKHYELIYKDVTAPVPGGGTQVFQTFSRKTIYPNGDYFLEYNEPVVKYQDGEIVETVLQENKQFICKLPVKPCGCVETTPENLALLQSCCGPSLLTTECGRCFCPPSSTLTYGWEIMGDRIYFDSDFCFDHALLRYFPEPTKGDFMVPLVAMETIIKGIKRELYPYETASGYKALAASRQQVRMDRLYMLERRWLFRVLNRIGLSEFYSTLLPPSRNWHC